MQNGQVNIIALYVTINISIAYFVTFLLHVLAVRKNRDHISVVQHGWYLQFLWCFLHFCTWLGFLGWGLRFFYITSISFNWTILMLCSCPLGFNSLNFAHIL
jgi:hypothetical protein